MFYRIIFLLNKLSCSNILSVDVKCLRHSYNNHERGINYVLHLYAGMTVWLSDQVDMILHTLRATDELDSKWKYHSNDVIQRYMPDKTDQTKKGLVKSENRRFILMATVNQSRQPWCFLRGFLYFRVLQYFLVFYCLVLSGRLSWTYMYCLFE